MRVSGGIAKNREIKIPEVPGMKPAQEIVRQAIFTILGENIKNKKCLDIFAGSGSIGIEALSRGAAWCDFVDINYQATHTIEENIEKFVFMDKSKVFTSDAVKFLENYPAKYDYIFMDPYYDQATHRHIFKLLPKHMHEHTKLFFLHGKDLDNMNLLAQTDLEDIDHRRYGATHMSIIQLKKDLIDSFPTNS